MSQTVPVPISVSRFVHTAIPFRLDFSPLLIGWLIESGSAWRVSFGYGIAALLLILAAATELKFGIDAEGKSLESIADPLSS